MSAEQAERNATHRAELEASSITVTALERSEWSRLACDAYRLGLNSIGHRFSVASAIGTIALSKYDELQAVYREWLTAGFPGLEAETLRARETRGVDVSAELEHYRSSMNGGKA